MPRAAIVSFRLGGLDGVSVEAAKWAWALDRLGFEVITVAGAGPVDFLVPGLDIGDHGPGPGPLAAALHGADLVVAENICSLPLNPAATRAVATALRGRRTILHHHDLPWQRARFADAPAPPDDPAWLHVTVNGRSQGELARRRIRATTIYNRVDPDRSAAPRDLARKRLGLGPDEVVVLQPTRALARKNIPAALELCSALGATYWLTGPAEEGFGPTARRLLDSARCPTRWDGGTLDMDAAYGAADLVVLPSTWEGFGLPAIESAVMRRPLAIADYPVATELRAHGFRWFGLGDLTAIKAWLAQPEVEVLDHNQAVARRHFSLRTLPLDLQALFDGAGWSWSHGGR